MTEEIWKSIIEFPDYEVSSIGQVRRVVPGKRNRVCGILKPWLNNKGYECISLSLNGKSRHHLVSRLVCRAFHGEPPTPKHDAAHGDGKPLNNREDNLRWATRVENMADSFAHGTFCAGNEHWSRKHPEKRSIGEAHGHAKLTVSKVKEIRSSDRMGSALAASFGVSRATISLIRNRKRWAHVA